MFLFGFAQRVFDLIVNMESDVFDVTTKLSLPCGRGRFCDLQLDQQSGRTYTQSIDIPYMKEKETKFSLLQTAHARAIASCALAILAHSYPKKLRQAVAGEKGP